MKIKYACPTSTSHDSDPLSACQLPLLDNLTLGLCFFILAFHLCRRLALFVASNIGINPPASTPRKFSSQADDVSLYVPFKLSADSCDLNDTGEEGATRLGTVELIVILPQS